MSETEIYQELEAAERSMRVLEMVNAYSLDTPEKKLSWDVQYATAKDRWQRAYVAKCALVEQVRREG